MLIKINSTPVITFQVGDISFDMIEVGGGSFMMGGGEYEDEKPIHQVEMSSFLLGKYPVTQVFWEAIMGSNPSSIKEKDHPVEQINWYEATQFCNTLSEQLQKEIVYSDKEVIDYSVSGFRLPTEAEWEYAARGGKYERKEALSTEHPYEVGWYRDNSFSGTKPVGMKLPNQLGLYDMRGNVWEWCNDWYRKDYYASSPSLNPRGEVQSSSRVLRGGGWTNYAQGLSITNRGYSRAINRNSDLGFRICLPRI